MGNAEPNRLDQPPGDHLHVEAAIGRLDELDTVGIDDAVKVYEDIHRSLSSALEGSTEAPRAPE